MLIAAAIIVENLKKFNNFHVVTFWFFKFLGFCSPIHMLLNYKDNTLDLIIMFLQDSHLAPLLLLICHFSHNIFFPRNGFILIVDMISSLLWNSFICTLQFWFSFASLYFCCQLKFFNPISVFSTLPLPLQNLDN